MRLPDAQVRQGLVHDAPAVRDLAFNYFAESFSPDAEVMPLVIQAIERFGPEAAFRSTYSIGNLVQSPASIDWVIRQLARRSPAPPQQFVSNLIRLLEEADPALWLSRLDEILPELDADEAAGLRGQIELASWSGERCWQELEALAAAGLADPDGDIDYAHAGRVVRALARQGEPFEQRAVELLSRNVTDYDTDPLSFLEIFLTEFVGRRRLEAAAPLLVNRVREVEVGTFVWEDTQEALARIAAPATVALLFDQWETAPRDFQLLTWSTLEHFHADATVEKGLEMLAREEDWEFRTWIMLALIPQLSPETIEPISKIVRDDAYDTSLADVRYDLTAAATLLGIDTPELRRWKDEAEREERELRERVRRFEAGTLLTPPPPRQPTLGYASPQPILADTQRVGRNDPCPCGSGKKFKKCCLNKA